MCIRDRYGVRLKASAPSIHMIRADIETAVSPIVGNEKQSEDCLLYTSSPAAAPAGDGREEALMNIVVWKSPRALRGILRKLFRIQA